MYMKSIRILEDDMILVSKSFAKKYLSKECISLKDFTNNVYYGWGFEASAYIVMFELPSLFDIDYYTVISKLGFYCGDYMTLKGITRDNISEIYAKNLQKKIKE